jgi:hypothetical protein
LCPIANNNQLGGGAIGVDFAIVFDETIMIVEIVSANEAIAIDRAIARGCIDKILRKYISPKIKCKVWIP